MKLLQNLSAGCTVKIYVQRCTRKVNQPGLLVVLVFCFFLQCGIRDDVDMDSVCSLQPFSSVQELCIVCAIL